MKNTLVTANVAREIGKHDQIVVEFEISADYLPGERRTWDYPGSPDGFECVAIRCDKIRGFCAAGDETYSFTRRERPDWFALLDQVMAARVSEDEAIEELRECGE